MRQPLQAIAGSPNVSQRPQRHWTNKNAAGYGIAEVPEPERTEAAEEGSAATPLLQTDAVAGGAETRLSLDAPDFVGAAASHGGISSNRTDKVRRRSEQVRGIAASVIQCALRRA